jgi:hypothetical protein
MISLLDTTQVQYEAISYAWGEEEATEELAMYGTKLRQSIKIRKTRIPCFDFSDIQRSNDAFGQMHCASQQDKLSSDQA